MLGAELNGLSEHDIRRIVKALLAEVGEATVTPREELSAIAAAAARTAVQEYHMKTWATLGFDLANMKDVNRLRANLDFLNAFHRGSAAAATKFFLVMIALVASAMVAALWLGFKAALHR